MDALARGQGSRFKIISRTPSYHGSTLRALAVTGVRCRQAACARMLRRMPKIPAPLTYRPPEGMDGAAMRLAMR